MTTTAAEWLSPTEIAQRLACSNDTVLRAIKRGDLPAVQYGRLVRVARADLDRFLARHRNTR
jgi:excisionase family DNA binding protein